MLEKVLCFLSLLVFVAIHAHAQKEFVELGGGLSHYGTTFYGGYVHYFTEEKVKFNSVPSSLNPGVENRNRKPHRLYGKINLFYEMGSGNSAGIKYSAMGIDVAAFYNLITVSHVFYVNAKGGLTLSSDKLRSPITSLDSKGNTIQSDYTTLKYGVIGGIETELLLLPKIILVTGWDQRYLLDSKQAWGTLRWYAYAGFRFKIK